MKKLFTGASGTLCSYHIAELIRGSSKPAIILMNNKSSIRDLSQNLDFYLDGLESVKLTSTSAMTKGYDSQDRNSINTLIKAISLILQKKPSLIYVSTDSFLENSFDPNEFSESNLQIKIGDKLDLQQLKLRLSDMGYENLPLTEAIGEFSTRGELLDIYSPSSEYPVRIDLFDEIVESITEFDPSTQRSIGKLNKTLIVNSRIGDKKRPLSSLLSDELVIIPDADDLVLEAEDGLSLATALGKDGLDLYAFASFENSYTYLPETIAKDTIRLEPVPSLNSSLARLSEYTARLASASYQVNLVLDGKFYDTVSDYIVSKGAPRFNLIRGTLASGFLLPSKHLCYISVTELYHKHLKTSRNSKSAATDLIFGSLNIGDYVVHEDFGIGQYTGTKFLERDGKKSEYLVIKYDGTDIVYIPTDKIYLVERYVGPSGKEPRLSNLHTPRWARTKERARQDIREIAEDLVRLYAKRNNSPGFPFPQDDSWQRDFEEKFPYVETDDQLNAAFEIKQDMERPIPMDRLLLGDVGYGKTEVAARAIFKALAAGKQVALLAPTTLLVSQHYQVLSKRFADFPFHIEYLSRFKTKKEQEEIKAAIAQGQIDFIIGTHSLLSSTIQFRDLGLLVIDEEQRFGVKHKEKIKQLKESIDVLTISATPIPRTLNMSLMGIKDISLLNTPPGERLPVKTFVGLMDEALIKEAINQELKRGGQVFVVNHRIAGLNTIASTIRSLVPAARVSVSHGQINEQELLDTMQEFVNGDIDVLVSTSIIENGIDIPRANTIIILNCENFGLAELYQMRGRVGRSNIQGFAYLMHPPQKKLKEPAIKRLRAIKDFTEFGSGLKLAMVDLELRGGGNILGEAQSGQIDEIGYEMYVSMINQAIAEFKGEPIEDKAPESRVQIPMEAYIDETYISDENMRLDIYRKITRIKTREDLQYLLEELRDRFGRPPIATINLLYISLIRALSSSHNVKSIEDQNGEIRINLDSGDLMLPFANNLDFLESLVLLLENLDNKFSQ